MHVADEDAFQLLKLALVLPQCQLNAFSGIHQIRVPVDVHNCEVVPLEGTGTAAPVPRNTTSKFMA